MILFREKYPRWWFDWNLELMRFSNRVGVYCALMDDRYPSTDDHQAVHLDFGYPDAQADLNRWLPLVKWFLAIPHYFVLFFLYIGAFFVVIAAWFAILFTGRYPRGIFDFLVGVGRWHNRVVGYALHPRHRPVPAVPAGSVGVPRRPEPGRRRYRGQSQSNLALPAAISMPPRTCAWSSRLVPVAAPVAERCVERAPAVVALAPRDRMVAHRRRTARNAVSARVVRALVDREEHVDGVARIGAEVVPLLLARPASAEAASWPRL